MTTIDDLIIRYGIVGHRRFYEREKVTFLKGIAEEFKKMGYPVEIKVSKKGQFRSYNLYVGNAKEAGTVVTTYYDTPAKNFSARPYRVLSKANKGFSYYLSTFLPMILIVAFGLSLIKMVVMPHWSDDRLTGLNVLFVLLLLFLFSLTLSYRKGMGNRKNMVRNTSSVLVLIEAAKEINPLEDVAFALTDFGCVNYLGEEMVKRHIGASWKNKQFIMLDVVGASGNLVMFASSSFKQTVIHARKMFQDLRLIAKDLDKAKSKQRKIYPNSLIIASGSLIDDELVVATKDHALDKERIKQVAKLLGSIV